MTTTEVSLKILETDPTYRANMKEWRSGKVKLINFDKTKQELGREVLILLITDSIVEIVLQRYQYFTVNLHRRRDVLRD